GFRFQLLSEQVERNPNRILKTELAERLRGLLLSEVRTLERKIARRLRGELSPQFPALDSCDSLDGEEDVVVEDGWTELHDCGFWSNLRNCPFWRQLADDSR